MFFVLLNTFLSLNGAVWMLLPCHIHMKGLPYWRFNFRPICAVKSEFVYIRSYFLNLSLVLVTLVISILVLRFNSLCVMLSKCERWNQMQLYVIPSSSKIFFISICFFLLIKQVNLSKYSPYTYTSTFCFI